ncbi:unnamed protein product [Blepharisma stoltei]|uniref:ATP synthase F0 subunit 8 n=1 Tax=Blepharisma stoltei TaxID=1481888 RepID=A0AAU9JJN5_9CILI|nr:unnamed protein product [Blepharisma stoltei]
MLLQIASEVITNLKIDARIADMELIKMIANYILIKLIFWIYLYLKKNDMISAFIRIWLWKNKSIPSFFLENEGNRIWCKLKCA